MAIPCKTRKGNIFDNQCWCAGRQLPQTTFYTSSLLIPWHLLLPSTNFHNVPQPSATFMFHKKCPPTYVFTYLDVDRLVSTSAHMSELVKPFSMGLLKPNWRHTLEVPLKYRSIHVTTTQGSLPRLPTYPISDLVQTIAYIKLPTAKAYGTFLISTFSVFFFKNSPPNSLLLASSAELTGFAFSMLKR